MRQAPATTTDSSAQDPGYTSLPYRSDIDGLRAIAVLAVLFYHFGLPGFDGGFVGVDVFFVISGFLIGGILWREYESTGRIWLRHFYVRRFRRLAPAFFTMAMVTALFSWALLLPFEFREFGKQLISATIYLSNVLFFRQAGYFDTASEDKPLLHTWSLAVEEQFYVFLPLFILLFSRNRRALLVALVGCWAASLAACIWFTPSHQTATFYLFPFRAWELLSGVLLAIWGCETGRRWRGHALLSGLGLALVLGSLLFIPAGPHFPGLFAVFPVLGAVLLLANGCGRNPVNRLLSTREAVFFGKISYSLYLWHWPVMTLSVYLRGGYANLAEAVVWMAVSVGLAWLSWRFVENPVRHLRVPGVAILGGTALASAAMLGLGGWLYLKDGLPGRFGAEVRPHIAASADFLQDWSRCHTPAEGPLMGLEICPIGPDGTPEVLVWGDSHVRAFKEGLDLAAHEAGTPGLIIWRAGCPPLFDVRKVESAATQAQDTACTNANLQIKQSFDRLDGLKKVLLIGRWTYYANGTGIGLDAENTIAVHPVETPTHLGEPQAAIVATAAEATVNRLLDTFEEVIVLRQPPEIAQYDSRLAAREAAHRGWPLAKAPVTQPDIPRAALAQRIAPAEAPWRALAESGVVTWLDPWPRICDDTACHALVDDAGYYFDNNHVTNSAARALRDLFAPVFASGEGAGS
ncbi:acyltransferase [Salipiger sp. P9]|uniref:acyltransferase family protein n=1 Tax=Salipiger pentaromativorans TaxID=2943193 RepID=UPI002157DAA6|nr:acyltransferase family protein [Salipiger pentaromativorans]MCR8549090.1 acyltransferase [Salipiger pentaromativorans]